MPPGDWGLSVLSEEQMQRGWNASSKGTTVVSGRFEPGTPSLRVFELYPLSRNDL